MADNSLNVVIRGKDELSPEFNRIESRLIRFVGAVSSALAAIKISVAPITSAGDLERELANVRKTTGFTATEISKLNNELLEMSLRIDVSAIDLAKIAAAAGQQGLGGEGVRGIVAFTESVARMASVLDITAEQAASDIGKILNVFKIPITEVERVVSAFNKVTNNAPAQGRQVLDIVKRIGDAAEVSENQVGSLTNAIGLAATGLELGIGPEVVGTSFVKIFAQMQTKAEDFAKVMNMSTKDWSAFVEKDGVKALQAFNRVLRKMPTTERDSTISSLEGQGRVFGLGRKLARDTLDVTLTKNIKNAETGYASGLSAIEEQRTVLNTLNAQLAILKNSFFKLVADGGTPLLRDLAAQARTVSDALQSEGVQSFVKAATQSIGDLVSTLLAAGKAISALNINWENFLKVLQVFVEVKVAQFFLSIAASALASANATRTSMLSMFTGFKAATDAATRAALASGDAAKVAAAQRLVAAEKEKGSLASLQKAYRDKQAAAAAASVAAQKAAQAEFALNNAIARQLAAQNAQKAANSVLGKATGAVNAAQPRIAGAVANQAAVEAAGLAKVEAARAIGNAKIQAAEKAHQQQLQLIASQFAGARSAADKAMRDGIIASETAFYNRQLASLKAADAKRIAQATAAAAALNAIASQRVIGANVNVGNLQRQQAAAGVGAVGAAAAAAAATSTTAAARREARLAAVELGRAKQAADAASASLLSFSRVLALLGTAFRFVLRSIVPLYFAFTILYSILDATGLLQPVLNFFGKLGEVLGLTSEASRKEAARQAALREEMAKTNAKIKEQIDAYKELIDASTGRRDPGDLDDELVALENTGEVKERQKLTANIAGAAVGAQLMADESEQSLKALPDTAKNAQKSFDAIKKKYLDLQTSLKQLEAIPLNLRLNLDTGKDNVTGEIDKIKEALATIAPAYAKAQADLNALTQNGGTALEERNRVIIENLKQQESQVASLFTEQSKELFLKKAVPLRAALDELDKLEAERAKLVGEPPLKGKEQEQVQKLETNKTQLDAAKVKVETLRGAFKDLRDQIMQLPAIDKLLFENVAGSVGFIDELMRGPTQTVTNFTTILSRMETRKIAGVSVPELVGDRTGKVIKAPPSSDPNGPNAAKEASKEAANEARRLAKAEDALRIARIEADLARQRQTNDKFLREQQRIFDLGLLSFKEYYAKRQAIEQANLKGEITAQTAKIDSKKKERTQTGLKPSDRVKIDAEIVSLEAQRDVMVSKLEEVPKEIATSITKSVKEFNEGRLTAQLDVSEVMGIGSAVESFDTQINLITSQITDRLNRFKAELAAGTPGVTQAFIDNFRLSELLKAVDPVLQAIANKAQIAARAVQTAFARVESNRSQGKYTDREAEAANNIVRAAEAEVLKEKIARTEEVIEASVKRIASEQNITEATVRSTDAIKKQKVELDALKQQYEELTVVVDEFASSVNSAVEATFTSAISSFMSGPDASTLKQLAKLRSDLATANTKKEKREAQQAIKEIEEQAGIGFKNRMKLIVGDITKAVQDGVSKDLAQTFIKDFLGGGGTGGIGGFFSKLLNPNGPQAKNALVDKELLGRSEATPMYVKLVGKGKPGEGDNAPPAYDSGDRERVREEAGELADAFDRAPDAFPALPAALPDIADLTAEDFSDFGGNADVLTSAVDSTFDSLSTSIVENFDAMGAGIESGGLGLDTLFGSLSDALSSVFSGLGEASGSLAKTLSSLIGSIFGAGTGGSVAAGGLAKIIGSFFHTGGVVGEGAVTRHVNPMVFAGAVRYHTGGIAGLQPDEVPSILRKGEEVLTADNPRHRDNLGSNAPARVTINVTTPDASSFRRSQDQIVQGYGRAMEKVNRRNGRG